VAPAIQLTIDAARRPCPQCGQSMEHKATQARYCSKNCQARARNHSRYDGKRRWKYEQLQDREWLRQHSIDLEESDREIAALVGCSKYAVQAARRHWGLARKKTRRPLKKRRGLDEQKIVAAYQRDLMPIQDIADLWNVGRWTIGAVLRDHGVMRTQQEGAVVGAARARARQSHAKKAEMMRRHTGKRANLRKHGPHDSPCFFCGSWDALEWHHINGVRNDERRENLLPLCPTCHVGVEWLIKKVVFGLAKK